uniref:DDE_3 domain-containing protein n=1 Tax=Heterorhabditis bacteriophora TaxID=37862 RepID=A0A1I7WGQ0_HETBA
MPSRYGRLTSKLVVSMIVNRINCGLYCRIIENLYLPFVKNVNNNARLVQDNDPKHKRKYTQDRFAHMGIKCLDWTPKSPDHNPIRKKDFDYWYSPILENLHNCEPML